MPIASPPRWLVPLRGSNATKPGRMSQAAIRGNHILGLTERGFESRMFLYGAKAFGQEPGGSRYRKARRDSKSTKSFPRRTLNVMRAHLEPFRLSQPLSQLRTNNWDNGWDSRNGSRCARITFKVRRGNDLVDFESRRAFLYREPPGSCPKAFAP